MQLPQAHWSIRGRILSGPPRAGPTCSYNACFRPPESPLAAMRAESFGEAETARAVHIGAEVSAQKASKRASEATLNRLSPIGFPLHIMRAHWNCRLFSSTQATAAAAPPANIDYLKKSDFEDWAREARGKDGLSCRRTLPPAMTSVPTAATAAAEDSADDKRQQLERLWRFPEKPPHIPSTVWRGMLRGLHLSADNPIGIITRLVESFFRQEVCGLPFNPSIHKPKPQQSTSNHGRPLHPHGQQQQTMSLQTLQEHAGKKTVRQQQHMSENNFLYLDHLSPLVSVQENFDSLLIGAAHCSRSTSDTYYLDPSYSLSHSQLAALAATGQDGVAAHTDARKGNESSNSESMRMVLRTHGTAHQAAILGCGLRRAIWSGAVARRDQVDPTHYPVFHQIDGIRIFEADDRVGASESDLLRPLERQCAALLKAAGLAKQLQTQREQKEWTGETEQLLRRALDEASAATALPEASVLSLFSFACFDEANPHRTNPVVLQLQVTLERLVRFLLAHRPEAPSARCLMRDISSFKTGSSKGSSSHHSGGSEPLYRWIYDAQFPFTSPSLELEVFHEGKWLEVLGAGEIQQQIIHNACSKQQQGDEKYPELLRLLPSERQFRPFTSGARGWAFGLGIERFAMLLFSIDDIRLLWSEDPRFTQQYSGGCIQAFVPFSHMPPVFKDVSFWLLPEESTRCRRNVSKFSAQVHELLNGVDKGMQSEACRSPFDLSRFYEVCREEGGALIESVTLRDTFIHPRTGCRSLCFRFTYKALDRTLTHPEVNAIQDRLIAKLKEVFAIELR